MFFISNHFIYCNDFQNIAGYGMLSKEITYFLDNSSGHRIMVRQDDI